MMEYLAEMQIESIFGFGWLSLSDVCTCLCVSKQWRDWLKEGRLADRIWKSIHDWSFGGPKFRSSKTWYNSVKIFTVDIRKQKKKPFWRQLQWAAELGHGSLCNILWIAETEENWGIPHKIQDPNKLLAKAAASAHFSVLEWCSKVGIEGDWVSVICTVVKEGGSPSIVQKLIDRTKIDINGFSIKGDTLISAAIAGENLPVLEYLKEIGADISHPHKFASSALHLALAKNSSDILDCLKDFMGEERFSTSLVLPGRFGYRPLHLAAADGLEVTFDWLLTNGADPFTVTGNQEHPIHIAASRAEDKAVYFIDKLLSYGENIDVITNHGYTPLYFAAMAGLDDAVNYLLEHGANICPEKDNPVAKPLLLSTTKPSIYHMLLDAGAPLVVPINGMNVISEYIVNLPGAIEEEETISVLDRLLKLGVLPVNDATHKNPAHYAVARAGPVWLVEWCIEKANIGVNSVDGSGNTLLHTCIHNSSGANSEKYEEIINYLIMKQANVHLANNTGITPLHIAARNAHHLSTIRRLIRKGANVNALDNNKNTPLHIAAMMSQTKLVVYFVEQLGADVTAKNDQNHTPLEVAQRTNTPRAQRVIEFLTSFMTANLKL